MSQSFQQLGSSLFVRDNQGRYQPATAGQILDAARQVVDQQVKRGDTFGSPRMVCEYLLGKLAGYEREVFAVLLLDAQHRLIEYVELFQGTLCEAAIYPREVVKLALQKNAAALILSHNHPAGNAAPSLSDHRITQHLKQALALVEVNVLDHVIVAGTETYSFAESGFL